jgi:hypothetical protein
MSQRRASDASDATPQFSGDITFTGDSAFAHVSTAGGAPQEQRFAVQPGAIPYFSPSFALVELGIARERAQGRANADVPMMNIGNAHPFQMTVASIGADSVTVTLGAAQARLAVETDGRIRGGVIPDQGLVLSRAGAMSDAAMRVEKPDYGAPGRRTPRRMSSCRPRAATRSRAPSRCPGARAAPWPRWSPSPVRVPRIATRRSRR